ncbi:MAG: phasin family protein [Clostridium sp.]
MMNEAKNLLLATIGAASLTYEKASETIVELVEKGKLTVEDGRELTEELTRDLKRDAEALKNKVKEDADIVRPITKSELNKIISEIELNHKRDFDAINNRIDELQQLIDLSINKG